MEEGLLNMRAPEVAELVDPSLVLVVTRDLLLCALDFDAHVYAWSLDDLVEPRTRASLSQSGAVTFSGEH